MQHLERLLATAGRLRFSKEGDVKAGSEAGKRRGVFEGRLGDGGELGSGSSSSRWQQQQQGGSSSSRWRQQQQLVALSAGLLTRRQATGLHPQCGFHICGTTM